MKIAFLTSGHLPFDDRIFHHLARTLASAGHSVEIISSKSDIKGIFEGISINCFNDYGLAKKHKIRIFIQFLQNLSPSVIICSEPLPLLAANRFRKEAGKKTSVIYDITEWYPSSKNIEHLPAVFKIPAAFRLLAFNIYASSLTDGFIFGEWHKSRPYRMLFPFRKYEFVTYYPDLTYIKNRIPEPISDCLHLLYSGRISRNKGFMNFMAVVRQLASNFPGMLFKIKIIGWYEDEKDKAECDPILGNLPENILIERSGRLDFHDYLKNISETDIFTDFREITPETSRCLPIKLFYFAAFGRPVIFSDLKAIRHNVGYDKFGYLADPGDTEKILSHITGYINDKELYISHCINARKLAEERYNWDKIKMQFLNFINSHEA